MFRIIIYLFLSGIFFGSGPCIASCGPILISYTAATKKNPLKGLMVYTLFSISRISVYIALSLSIFFLGKFTMDKLLGVLSRYVLIIGGAFIILIGLLIILGRRWDFGACAFLNKKILEHDKKSIAMLGIIIGLLPCGPLLAILSYIGLVSNSWASSIFYSLSFGIGTFLSPLLLLTLAAGFIARLFKNKEILFQRIISIVCGLIIIFLGGQLIYRGFLSA